RPLILLSGHFGNWEIANTTFGLFGYPAGVVARDLDNPYIHRWFEKFREFTGHQLISKKGGGTDMTDLMEQGGTVALLGDQDAGKRGLFVPFFGKEASTFKSIALLSIQMDAPILVGYTSRLPDNFMDRRWTGFEMGCADIIDPRRYTDADAIRRITEDYTLALERAIRRAPEQYFWVHRRWKSEPRKRTKKPETAEKP
ncbi:MAG: lysophospholipid acyltransferase family protein, partial [Planctomycetaceae bacterium]|nr:lysophospholipid acyltransferase family protein [Planctomycetaceae bacterium]